VLCSPHNPVGRLWTLPELQKLAALCEKHNLTVVSDEIHCDLVLRGKHIVFGSVSPYARDNSIICTSITKTFNVAGLLASNALVSNPDIRARLRALVNKFHLGINTFVPPAVIAAYTEGESWLDAALVHIRGNCDYFAEHINTRCAPLKIAVPDATYLMWLDCRGLGYETAADLNDFFAGTCGIAANDGVWFGPGGAGFKRINVACPRAMLEDCAKRIENGLKKR